MKKKTSFYLVVTLTIVFIAYLISVAILLSSKWHTKSTVADREITTETKTTPTQPDDHFIIEDFSNSEIKDNVVKPEESIVITAPDDTKVDEIYDDVIIDDSDDTSSDDDVTDVTPPTEDDSYVSGPVIYNFVVVEEYQNSMADGSGKMLWNLNVSYNDLNASDLLAQHGLYIVFKTNFDADGENSTQWYSFAYAFYNEEGENYNSTGYLNGYVYSIQFAIVDIAPDDIEMGGYNDGLLTDDNFITFSDIFVNQYFAA